MIAGGLDRGNEFDELVPDITGLKKMVILGQSAERGIRAADKAGVTYVDATDYRIIFRLPERCKNDRRKDYGNVKLKLLV